MWVVFAEIGFMIALFFYLLAYMRKVRRGHDDEIVEHWRRNGRDKKPWGW